MNKKFFVLTLVVFLISNQKIFAQWSYGLGLGSTLFFGDITLLDPLNSRGVLGSEIWYEMSNLITLKTGSNIYQIAGDDRLKKRNRSFRSINLESYVALILTLKKPRDRKGKVSQLWYPFSYLGFGLTTNDPEGRSTSGNKYWDLARIQPEGKEIPAIVSFGLVGGGLVFHLSRDINLVSDVGFRVTTSDYLDGVSQSSFLPSLAARGYFSEITFGNTDNILGGNPKTNDIYAIFSFKLFYAPYDFGFKKKYTYNRKKGRRRRRR